MYSYQGKEANMKIKLEKQVTTLTKHTSARVVQALVQPPLTIKRMRRPGVSDMFWKEVPGALLVLN